jgi:hypothetical protein
LLASYTDAFNDPPARQAAVSFARAGFEVTVVHPEPRPGLSSAAPDGVRDVRVERRGAPLPDWLRFRATLAQEIERTRPAWVVTIMLQPLAALPLGRRSFRLLACIYDIPSLRDAGRLDGLLARVALIRLRAADLVWSSDPIKARLVGELARLELAPLICHNCPPLGWIAPGWPRDGWLRDELRRQGIAGECLVVRAGAIGEACGIEETLEALRDVPGVALLLMGRPDAAYREAIERRIAALGLSARATLWERPSDEKWKAALAGADAGHLIHQPGTGARERAFRLNSSLSNNRLFQYLAAGLPVIAYDDPRLFALYAEVPAFKVARLTHLTGDLRTLLGELAADEAGRRKAGEAALAAHCARYHWEHQFAPMLERVSASASASASRA